jgi:SAM-dependent methyltransferase
MIKNIKHRLATAVRRVWYRGNSRSCPLCKRGSRRFLVRGIVPRIDAMCPMCGALERHRILWLYFERKTTILSKPPKRVLHVAPEACIKANLRPLVGNGYVTADLLAPNVDVQMDITEIPFPDRSFDLIYCSHVLEHVPDDRKAMRECNRVLADDGMAILIVPIMAEKTIEDPTITDPKERLRLFGQEDHVRKYGPDYSERLQEAGFRVEVITPADFLNQEEVVRFGLAHTQSRLFICRK